MQDSVVGSKSFNITFTTFVVWTSSLVLVSSWSIINDKGLVEDSTVVFDSVTWWKVVHLNLKLKKNVLDEIF